MPKPKSEYAIQTVTNAVRLIEVLSDAEEQGVTELSRELDLHKNNVFRLLATLEEVDWVEQTSGNDRYRLGPGIQRAAQRNQRTKGLVQRARPVLVRLARTLSETVHLAVLRSFEVVHLDGVQPPEPLVAGLRLGDQLPAHCTALGKALLGSAGEGVLEEYDRRVIQPGELVAFTPDTVVDPHKLVDQLRHVRSNGYAVDSEEFARGLCCAAAPVLGPDGDAIAALSVSAPVCRMDAGRLHAAAAEAVSDAAEGLSQELGFVA